MIDTPLPMKVTDRKSAKAFFRHLLYVEHTSYHPDDDFHDYIENDTKRRTYTERAADERNREMLNAMVILADDKDPYQMPCNVMRAYMRIQEREHAKRSH